ncbi:MAG: class I SAM-dependent methyltransferase [Pseudomonadota bacterium]
MNDDLKRRRFERRWQSRFAEFARLRDDDAGIAGWSDWGLQTRFKCFTRLWRSARPGALYLDAGCGAGTYARWLAEQGLEVIGADYSQPTLLKATQRGAAHIAYCAADTSKLPFPDATMDGALCFGVLQAVWNSQPFVTELSRVLKPGGELWIDALNAHALHARWDIGERRLRGRPMHLRYESPRKLMAILRDAGFDDISRHWLPIMPSRLRRMQPLFESKPIGIAMKAVPGFGALTSHSFVIRAVRHKAVRAAN